MGLLSGKVALIAGVTNKSSIGWGIAEALHAQGARVAFACLEGNVRRVKRIAPMVDSELVFPCDVRSDADIEAVFVSLREAFGGRLDILVHSLAYAHIEDLGGKFIDLSREGWYAALDVSAYSLTAMSRHARYMMRAAGGGSIMTLTFVGGSRVVPGYNVMAVAKAALETSVRYLAYELGPDGIRVNAISPGPVPTLSSMVIEDFSTAMEMVANRAPLLRNITLQDIGGSAVFLASDLASGVTGSILHVDAGMDILAPPTDIHRKIKKVSKDAIAP